MTLGLGPGEVLQKCLDIGKKSFADIIEYLNAQYRHFCELSNVDFTALPWAPRVYSWDEFYSELAEKHGKRFTDSLDAYARKLNEEDPTLDMRLFSLKVAEEAWKWHEDKSPALVVFFGSVYSARIEMTRKTEKERDLLDAVESAVEKVRPESERLIKTRMFYPYISDSSFMAVCDELSSVQAIESNMPAWNHKYVHKTDKILEINVPVVNIGTFGRDGHMLTERVDMKQTFRNVPNITYETVVELLK